MALVGELIENFNNSIDSMFVDQQEIMQNSNIVFTCSISSSDQTYNWFQGKGPIQFYRNFKSITINGQTRELIPVVYVTGMSYTDWKFDHGTLMMRAGNGLAKTRYDRWRKDC